MAEQQVSGRPCKEIEHKARAALGALGFTLACWNDAAGGYWWLLFNRGGYLVASFAPQTGRLIHRRRGSEWARSWQAMVDSVSWVDWSPPRPTNWRGSARILRAANYAGG